MASEKASADAVDKADSTVPAVKQNGLSSSSSSEALVPATQPATDETKASESVESNSTEHTSSTSDTSSETTPTATRVSQPVVPAAAESVQPAVRNDAVTALQAMFPGMDATIISEVLAAHGGDADAASMALLELNNPDAPPSSGHAGGGHHAANATAQMRADEEYARQLMAQMEREHMQEYGRPLGSAPGSRNTASGGVNYDQLNYVPRQRNRHGQQGESGAGNHSPSLHSQQSEGNQQAGLSQWLGGQTGPDGRWKHQDDLDQLTEQFNKFADTGKKTFNSFLSKAKDKYAQAAQQRALQAQGNAQQGGGEGSGVKIGGFKLPNIPSPWQGGTCFRPGEKPMSPEREELRTGPLSPDTRSSIMKDYSQSPSRPSGVNTRDSYDDGRPAIQINKPLPTTSQAQPIRTASSTNAPALSGSPATTTPSFSTSPVHLAQQQSRNSFSSGSPAKVQMLPRQTINLLDQSEKDRNSRSVSPAAGGASGTNAGNSRKDSDYDDDSDSDVEYVRNPFNDDD